MQRLLSGSIGLKVLATLVAISAFVLLYEATTFDSREAAGNAVAGDPTAPVTGARLQFQATAYCKGKTTASGVSVRSGVAASDPKLLPVGTVLNVTTDTTKYNGIYTVMDTGPKVQGRILDLYMWSCHEALAFGRKASAGDRAPTRVEPERQLSRPDRSSVSPPRGGEACGAGRTSVADRRSCSPNCCAARRRGSSPM